MTARKAPGAAPLKGWRGRVAALKRSITVLHLAARHPATPWPAKVMAIAVVAYALSPIDLIPDPIPVLGYLDDLILLPLGIWLTMKLIPDEIWAECSARAERGEGSLPASSRTAAAAIVVLWLIAIYFAVRTAIRLASG